MKMKNTEREIAENLVVEKYLRRKILEIWERVKGFVNLGVRIEEKSINSERKLLKLQYVPRKTKTRIYKTVIYDASATWMLKEQEEN